MSFFRTAQPFDDFLEFGDPSHYTRVPDECYLLIADIRDSTAAIARGHYKAVNMIGAGVVVTIFNVLGYLQSPIAFGGDGAIAVIETAQLHAISAALRSLIEQARILFAMHLRVGLVPIAALNQAQADVWVAKYKLGGGPEMAFFRGAGLELAESWVKSGQYLLPETGERIPVSLLTQGLSCRWAAMPSRRGKILTLIIKATGKEPGERHLIVLAKAIHDIVDLNSKDSCPTLGAQLIPENITDASRIEAGLRYPFYRRGLHRMAIGLQMLLVRIVRQLNGSLGGIKLRQYLQDTVSHSDYLKYDGALRMVLDCTPEMVQQIKNRLDTARNDGNIYYGVTESDSALLTCFVRHMTPGEHLHFVDGSQGGYAAAASSMKQQAKEARIRLE